MGKTTLAARRAKLETLRLEKRALEHRLVEAERHLHVTQRMLENARKDNQRFRERLMELEGRSANVQKKPPSQPTIAVSTSIPVSKTAHITAMPTIKNKIGAEAKKGSLTLQQDEMKRKVSVGKHGPNISGGVVKRSSSEEKPKSIDSRSTSKRCRPVTSNVPAAQNKTAVVKKPQVPYHRELIAVGKPKKLPQVPVASVKSNPPCQHHMFRLSKHAHHPCLKCKQRLGPLPCWGCVVCGNAVHLRCRPNN